MRRKQSEEGETIRGFYEYFFVENLKKKKEWKIEVYENYLISNMIIRFSI